MRWCANTKRLSRAIKKDRPKAVFLGEMIVKRGLEIRLNGDEDFSAVVVKRWIGL